jgi:hypothetical protein
MEANQYLSIYKAFTNFALRSIQRKQGVMA